jgi:hypothetical protein
MLHIPSLIKFQLYGFSRISLMAEVILASSPMEWISYFQQYGGSALVAFNVSGSLVTHKRFALYIVTRKQITLKATNKRNFN